jgi:hypothetical protein
MSRTLLHERRRYQIGSDCLGSGHWRNLLAQRICYAKSASCLRNRPMPKIPRDVTCVVDTGSAKGEASVQGTAQLAIASLPIFALDHPRSSSAAAARTRRWRGVGEAMAETRGGNSKSRPSGTLKSEYYGTFLCLPALRRRDFDGAGPIRAQANLRGRLRSVLQPH